MYCFCEKFGHPLVQWVFVVKYGSCWRTWGILEWNPCFYHNLVKEETSYDLSSTTFGSSWSYLFSLPVGVRHNFAAHPYHYHVNDSWERKTESWMIHCIYRRCVKALQRDDLTIFHAKGFLWNAKKLDRKKYYNMIVLPNIVSWLEPTLLRKNMREVSIFHTWK